MVMRGVWGKSVYQRNFVVLWTRMLERASRTVIADARIRNYLAETVIFDSLKPFQRSFYKVRLGGAQHVETCFNVVVQYVGIHTSTLEFPVQNWAYKLD